MPLELCGISCWSSIWDIVVTCDPSLLSVVSAPGASDEADEGAAGEEPHDRVPEEPRDCHLEERPTQAGGGGHSYSVAEQIRSAGLDLIHLYFWGGK